MKSDLRQAGMLLSDFPTVPQISSDPSVTGSFKMRPWADVEAVNPDITPLTSVLNFWLWGDTGRAV